MGGRGENEERVEEKSEGQEASGTSGSPVG